MTSSENRTGTNKPSNERPPGTGVTDAYMTPNHALRSLTRLELAIMRVHEGFMRWAVEVSRRAVGSELSFQELALLHCLRMCGRNPTLSEMLLFLNRTDVPNLQYCLRKLETGGLIERVSGGGRGRRQTTYRFTDRGLALTDSYAAVRNPVLDRSCHDVRDFEQAMTMAAETLERLVGVYDHATQTVLNNYILDILPDDAIAESGQSDGPQSSANGADGRQHISPADSTAKPLDEKNAPDQASAPGTPSDTRRH